MLVGNATKVHYTVNYCCNAAGNFMPPFVIYKAKTLYQSWTEDGPIGAKYTVSPSGWMESLQFTEWFKSIYTEGTKQLEGPNILFVDGHGSHVSLEVIDLAIANKTSLICLPAHSSAHFQPLDRAVYRDVKRCWKSNLDTFYKKTRAMSVTKQNFPSLLNGLYEHAFKPHHAVSGFYKTGLYPLDPSQIKMDKDLMEINRLHGDEEDILSPNPAGTTSRPSPVPAKKSSISITPIHSTSSTVSSVSVASSAAVSFVAVSSSAAVSSVSVAALVPSPETSPDQASSLDRASQNLTSSLIKHFSFTRNKKASNRRGIDVGGKCMTGI